MSKDKSNDDEKSKSFWGTLPGLLGGCAAVITAIGSIITALYLLRPKETPTPVVSNSTPSIIILQPSPIPTNPPPQPTPTLKIADTVVVIPTPENLFDIVRANSGRMYFKDFLSYGAVVYSDRDYIYNDIPSFLDGAGYILTANEDKFGGRDFNFELSIFATRNVEVYVAHSDRYINKPDWLIAFQDTGVDLTYYVDSDLVTLSLYKRNYPAGSITLYGNIQPNETENHAMYTVVIVESK